MSIPPRDTIVNMLIVSFVTLAIWIWAASETTEVVTIFNQELSIEPSAGNTTLIQPATLSGIRIDLRGPARAVKAMASEFPELATVAVGSPGIAAQDGEQTVTIATIVDEIIRRTGRPVSVVATIPATAELTITLRTTQEADIVPSLAEGVRATGTITVEPALGSITLPTKFAGQGPIQLLAPITQAMLDTSSSGQRIVVKATVALPDALQPYADTIEFEPREVDVSIAVLSANVERTLPSVPIQVAAPPAELDRYTITITHGDGFLRDVVVRGPPETIQKIADGALSVVAFVHLSSDDLVKVVNERPVSMWMLPEGVTVVQVGDGASTTPRVSLEIIDRQTP